MDEQTILTAEELDTIGEVMNISMGSAATAVSSMLERQVTITTPHLSQNKIEMVNCSDLEPAILVKIQYIKGISGTNMILLRKHDMKLILDLLMGNDSAETSDEDFVFDDMSMSAACEVMNQMMGAASTAISEVLGRPVNISTPQAQMTESTADLSQYCDDLEHGDEVVVISFQLSIKDLLDTTFNCILPIALTREIVQSLNGATDAVAAETPAPSPAPAAKTPTPPAGYAAPAPTAPAPRQAAQPAPQPAPAQPIAPAVPSAPAAPNPAMPAQMPYGMPPAYGYGMPGMYGYGMNGQPMYAGAQPQIPAQPAAMASAGVNVQAPEFPNFPNTPMGGTAPYSTNLQMLMNVQLDVSVIIGRAKRSIKDILDFGQGTVVELDKQTGSPAEIVVNGQLLAYGDVVVVGDNFGVRVTEIVGTKELLSSLNTDGTPNQ
ncbi:MAG: flagellar motor switch phosphatase FliY [Faecalibacterium sp.]|jgi:flagellar motor switch protein FliN/FliY|nr:flagellar motor switch phosphatase FliY [Faecalibacterium sp.]